MNTKGVEDGITDEQAVRKVYPDADINKGFMTAVFNGAKMLSTFHVNPLDAWADARAKLPLRSATPEELTAQRESYGKNYKPGPTQATPFMPEQGYTCIPLKDALSLADEVVELRAENKRLRTLPVPERTAEMEELLYSALDRLLRNAQHIFDAKAVRDWCETFAEADSALEAYRNHIEGKPK